MACLEMLSIALYALTSRHTNALRRLPQGALLARLEMLSFALQALTSRHTNPPIMNAQRLQQESFSKRRLARPAARLFPAGLYLRKMRRGARILTSLPLKEVRGRPLCRPLFRPYVGPYVIPT